MELQNTYDELESRDTVVIAIAQEDETLEQFARFQSSGFDPAPRFELAADLNREHSKAYDRTTAYLIDEKGIVRQVFPMLIHFRATWKTILGEIDALDD